MERPTGKPLNNADTNIDQILNNNRIDGRSYRTRISGGKERI